jgi:L-alanine-DL-glutamate epimerase-like enolase superfamily enzyme
MKIKSIRIAELKVPLPRVLRLGSVQITTRDFVAVRIETDADVCGDAFGYSRGTPLFETLARASQGLIGTDPLLRRMGLQAFELANSTSRPMFARALSMLDIALWDMAAKVAGLPLFRLLGGLRTSAPVTAVAGYYMDQRPIAAIADEVAMRIDQGYPRVKVMLKGDDPAFDLGYLRAVTERAPGRVAADAHWSWSSLTEALRVMRPLDDLGLAFLEDPFVAQDVELTASLQSKLRTPIAAGEDVSDARAMSRLAAGVAVLRVDATTCGGITGAIAAMHAAHFGGCSVLPHVFAPLHLHLACAFPVVEGVEFIPPESGADPLEALLARPIVVTDGHMKVDEEPGAGTELDWTRVAASSSRVLLVEQPS